MRYQMGYIAIHSGIPFIHLPVLWTIYELLLEIIASKLFYVDWCVSWNKVDTKLLAKQAWQIIEQKIIGTTKDGEQCKLGQMKRIERTTEGGRRVGFADAHVLKKIGSLQPQVAHYSRWVKLFLRPMAQHKLTGTHRFCLAVIAVWPRWEVVLWFHVIRRGLMLFFMSAQW